MRKNLIVISFDYALARRTAEILSDKFDRRFFDMFDMFTFDNSPNTLTDVLRMNGEDYVNKEMSGILKNELDFSGVVFLLDPQIAWLNDELLNEIRENNVVIFLKRDFKDEYAHREKIAYKSEEEREYFTYKLDKLHEIHEFIEHELADISIDVDSLSYREIKDNILKKIDSLLNETLD